MSLMKPAAAAFALFAALAVAGVAKTPGAAAIAELREHVEGSVTFQSKVAASCEGKGSACPARAADLLFCELLKRARPDIASAACADAGAQRALPPQEHQPQPQTEDAGASEVDEFAASAQTTLANAATEADEASRSDKSDEDDAGEPASSAGNGSTAPLVRKAEAAFLAFKRLLLLQQEAKLRAKPQSARLQTGTPIARSFMQVEAVERAAPEEALAKEMTHDLEMNFNRIAPFGKEDTAKELQDHAASTQNTLVDAVENAEVAEIKRAVFRALTRLRAATIKEFDTIARLETQAIDAYNDAHHYRAENPLAHLHEDEAPVETDKLKSFH